MWRGKGGASEQKLRLIEVAEGAVVFERIAGPSRADMPLRLPTRCTAAQLEAAFEYEREATMEDLAC